MRSYFIRTASALLVAVSLTACGADEAGAEKLELLSVGISSDSLFKLLPTGPVSAEGADTVRVRHGYRMSRYLVGGQTYAVLYVRDEPGNVVELVEQKRETPIIIDGSGKVIGWGWKFYVEEGIKKIGLPTPLIEVPAGAPNAAKAVSGTP